MAIKTTRYSPDTCACIIDYTWDDTLSENNRTHTLSTFVNRCPDHSVLPTDQDRWNCVFEENPRKNFAFERILSNGPTTLFDTVDGIREFKKTIRPDLSWSGTAPNRVLTISLTGISLTTQQKNTIQSALNTRFGSGKVLIA